MTWSQWLGAAFMLSLMLWSVASILGPFRLDAGERPVNADRYRLVLAWFAGWRRRPRRPGGRGDWSRAGRLVQSFFTAVVLWAAGIGALTHREWVLGAVATVTGLALALVIIGYGLRPAMQPVPLLPGSPFRRSLRGYRTGEVDQVIAALESMTAKQIRQVRFGVAARGYDKRQVDQVLTEAVRSRVNDGL